MKSESNPLVWEPMSTIDLAPIDLNIYFSCTVSAMALQTSSHLNSIESWMARQTYEVNGMLITKLMLRYRYIHGTCYGVCTMYCHMNLECGISNCEWYRNRRWRGTMPGQMGGGVRGAFGITNNIAVFSFMI